MPAPRRYNLRQLAPNASKPLYKATFCMLALVVALLSLVPMQAMAQTTTSQATPSAADAQTAHRASQLLRFVGLVPNTYGKAINNGKIISDLQIKEAVTFAQAAEAAFGELKSQLQTFNSDKTSQVGVLFGTMDEQLANAAARQNIPATGTIRHTSDSILALLRATMPATWQQYNPAVDFDVVGSLLNGVDTAVAAGNYDAAETARLEAYATLEGGPEASIGMYAPQLVTPIENLFWYSEGAHRGLGSLIRDHAALSEVQTTHKELTDQLNEAQQVVKGGSAAAAVTTNAAIIVFREGLEAVLILASLMASLKSANNRKFRKPLSWGAAAAFVAAVLTWVLMEGVLSAFAAYGEALQAIVSLIAIGVLLLITNWFFHNVYWTGWIANFHKEKKRLIGGEAGQMLGLVVLGFTSIYREGFESVLFLQALVLQSGAGAVLSGIGLGLLGTALVGVLVFAVQAKLPHKKMLVATGVMIGAVLLVMVGNTAHVLQLVGWLPIHPVEGFELPYWTGLWLGIYTTWEGLLLQVAAGTFVIGSYFLAERQKHGHRTATPQREITPREA